MHLPPLGRPRSRTSRIRSTARLWAQAGVVVVALGVATGTTAAATPADHPVTAADTTPGVDSPDDLVGEDVAGEDLAGAALTSARALADSIPGTAIIAPAVVGDLGYTPVVDRTLATKATGDCSSPVPLPAAFEPACRVHDLGYDLLRVAHRHGARIPHGLRADLDSLLGRQMRQSCEGDAACTAMAGIAHLAVQLNTARQGHGAPVEEALPW